MNRIKEPSTWAGMAALFQALQFVLPQYAMLINAATAAAGGVAVVLREGGAPHAN
jgi:hypothetical protein